MIICILVLHFTVNNDIPYGWNSIQLLIKHSQRLHQLGTLWHFRCSVENAICVCDRSSTLE